MSNFAGILYAGIFDRSQPYAAWGLSCIAERLPMSQARWDLLTTGEPRQLAAVGLAAPDASGQYSTLRIEVLEPSENCRHEFTWQRGMPAAFSEEEQRFLAEALEHLVCAERLSRRLNSLLREAQSGESDPVGFAIVNADGLVESADRYFGDYLRQADAGWNGCELPFGFEWHEKLATRGLAHQGLYYRIDRSGEHYHVRVRKDRRALSVSSREMEVAKKLAGGLTFKEIARELGVAPSTVSTHAYKLYDKLGFRRRSQLVEWVSRQSLH